MRSLLSRTVDRRRQRGSMVLALPAQPAQWSGPTASQCVRAGRPRRGVRAAFVDTSLSRPQRPDAARASGRRPAEGAGQGRSPATCITLEPRATYRGPFTPAEEGRRRLDCDFGRTVEAGASGARAAGRSGGRGSDAEARRLVRLRDRSAAGRASLPLRRPRDRSGRRSVPATLWYSSGTTTRNWTPCRTTSCSTAAICTATRRAGARRGIAMNSRHTAVIDSYLSDFKEVGADSQAIAGWNGAGPFRIANNYLEAAGENVMFGGADPTIRDLVPADIEIRRNHFAKPLRWKIGHPDLRGRRVGGQEPVRAEERPARAHRRQPVRVQLAARAERLRDSVHRAEPGRRRAVVDRRRRRLREQRRAPRGAAASTSSAATTTIRASESGASKSATTCSSTSAARGAAAGSSSCWRAPAT